jgi:hypothetical protein
MDVIPLDAALVKGSHGSRDGAARGWPAGDRLRPALLSDGPVAATAVKQLILDHVFGASSVERSG